MVFGVVFPPHPRPPFSRNGCHKAARKRPLYIDGLVCVARRPLKTVDALRGPYNRIQPRERLRNCRRRPLLGLTVLVHSEPYIGECLASWRRLVHSLSTTSLTRHANAMPISPSSSPTDPGYLCPNAWLLISFDVCLLYCVLSQPRAVFGLCGVNSGAKLSSPLPSLFFLRIRAMECSAQR